MENTLSSYEKLENDFPKKAKFIFRKASEDARKQGHNVVQLVGKEIRRIKPDGTYTVIKTLTAEKKNITSVPQSSSRENQEATSAHVCCLTVNLK